MIIALFMYLSNSYRVLWVDFGIIQNVSDAGICCNKIIRNIHDKYTSRQNWGQYRHSCVQ